LGALWAHQRATTRAALTDEALNRNVVTRAFGTIPLGQFLWTFPNDSLIHAWDIAAGAGVPVSLPDDLVAWFATWGKDVEAGLRRPGASVRRSRLRSRLPRLSDGSHSRGAILVSGLLSPETSSGSLMHPCGA